MTSRGARHDQAIEQAAQQLRESTGELERALGEEDPQRLEKALVDQAECFQRLHSALGDTADPPRAQLEALHDEGEAAIAAASSQLDAIRRELDQIRRARSVARRAGDGEQPARFVSRHA